MDARRPGISGLALYTPRRRVRLDAWCGWTGAVPAKVEAVVGRSFRMCGPDEGVYTMAAGAVLRLLLAHEVHPDDVGMLVLATESSTDNSAGAIIVKGMVDRALEARGLPPLSRRVEVPEVKHACLGGVYGLKQALRYVAGDGRGRRAIVVASDVAEYARGSSGEATQGAGAVAMLVDPHAAMVEVDLERTGSAAAYRGADFRKPARRHQMPGYHPGTRRLHDFPVFNGSYSTWCYLDAVRHAFADHCLRSGVAAGQVLAGAGAVFLHRPYRWMPVQAAATLHAVALADDPRRLAAFAEGLPPGALQVDAAVDELHADPDLYARFHEAGRSDDPAPHARELARRVRETPAFARWVDERMSLGADGMCDLGNLYTAALPAWLAAGVEEAMQRGVELAGRPALAIGYGSGDAAEVLPLRFVSGWQEAARRVAFAQALADPVDLDRAAYEALHDGRPLDGFDAPPRGGFVVDRIGQHHDDDFQDIGLEYYRFVAA
ncbi:MAG: hydroxymethylglutaryl-CoA synthase [Alphaproteobacteria bacterium]|nr:hydroxymethylglutaryl-CoA synthase [Alphaproteobacteria bacterium]